MKTYDLIIVGGGPAGITAAIYAARRKLDFLMVTVDIGGQAIWSGDIENYTGYQFITGTELVEKFREHLTQFNLELHENEKVTQVRKEHNAIQVHTEKEKYQAKTTIIASGRTPRNLNVEGEKEFKDRGLTYCATCDAPLFAGKEVAVVGGGNAGLDAALQLIHIARKIYLIEIAPELTADPVMVEKVKRNPKVTIYTDAKVQKIYGDKFVGGIEIAQREKTQKLDVQGLFVEIGSAPNSDIVKGVKTNEWGEIIVNCSCHTNLPGIFAAGDVTTVYAKQIITACGEGAKATIAASDYLNRKG